MGIKLQLLRQLFASVPSTPPRLSMTVAVAIEEASK